MSDYSRPQSECLRHVGVAEQKVWVSSDFEANVFVNHNDLILSIKAVAKDATLTIILVKINMQY